MKKLLLRCLAAACLGIGSSVMAAERAITPASVESFFDTAFAVQQQDHGIVGATVAVVYRGDVLLSRGYGWADLEAGIPVDPAQTLFRIASISKPFIWTAVMQLHEAGKLDLEADVNDYLTAFKIPQAFNEPVRVHHLLSHTAGFEDQPIGMNSATLEGVVPLAQYLATWMPLRVRPPGEFASYSNWGTSLAGYIVEEVSGQAWADYVDEHILVPLEMASTNTQTPPPAHLAERMSLSYKFSNGTHNAQPYEWMQDAPAGVISTTADDMTRFMLAHLGDGAAMLSPETAALMRTPLFDPHPAIDAMYYGFFSSEINGHISYGHGGDTNQFHSDLAMFPDLALGIFVSYNSDPGAGARDRIIDAFMDHFFPVSYLAGRSTSLPFEPGEFEGDYVPLRSSTSRFERMSILVQYANVGVFEDYAEGINLFGRRYHHAGDDVFEAENSDRTLFFTRNEAGVVTHLNVNGVMASFEKVSGLDAPGNQQVLIALIIITALFAIVLISVGLVRGHKDLPLHHALTGLVFSVLVVTLYVRMVMILTGDVDHLVAGVPDSLHYLLLLMDITAVLGIVVAAYAALQWLRGYGAMVARVGYLALGLAGLANFWVAWYFNLIAYLFDNMPRVS